MFYSIKWKRKRKFAKNWAEGERIFYFASIIPFVQFERDFFSSRHVRMFVVRSSPAIWRYAVSHQHLFYIKPQINVCAFVLCSVVGSHVISFYSPLMFIIFYAICCFYPLYIFQAQWFIVSQSLWVKWRSLQKKLNQKQIHFVGRIKNELRSDVVRISSHHSFLFEVL